MTEAVSLGELLHEEALFGLTGVRKVGVPRGHLFPSGLCLSAISLVVCAWPDPLPTGLNGDGKNVQTLWWAELDRLHSMTRAHPPLVSELCPSHKTQPTRIPPHTTDNNLTTPTAPHVCVSHIIHLYIYNTPVEHCHSCIDKGTPSAESFV